MTNYSIFLALNQIIYKMLVKQELINKIKDYFDLNVYETKVWLALISKGVASAGEIASISRVPRSRAYDVLESLEKKRIRSCEDRKTSEIFWS